MTPLVLVWGGAQDQIGDDWVVDGVRILPGRSLRAWLTDHAAAQTVTHDEARKIAAALKDFRTRVRPPRVSRDAATVSRVASSR